MVLCWSCWTYFKPSQSQSKDFPALQLLLHIHWVFLFSGRSSGEQVCSLQKPTQALDRVHKAGEGQLNIHVSIWSYKVKFNLTVKHSYLSPPLRGSPIPSEGNTLIKWPSALLHVHLLSCPGVPYKELQCWQDVSVLWRCFAAGYKRLTDSNELHEAPSWKKKAGKGKIICHWSVKDFYHKTTKLSFSNYKTALQNAVEMLLKTTRNKKIVFPSADSDCKLLIHLFLLISPYSFIFKDLGHLLASTF